jgi:hypothetical protein
MDYKALILDITKDFNLVSELDRRKAYNKCIEYAEENFDDTEDYNPFISEAAELFSQTRLFKDFMKNTIKTTGDEKIQLSYSESTGHEIIGNPDGLMYLSRLLRNLSRSKIPGEHINFYYSKYPLFGESYPFTIFHEDDKWFSQESDTFTEDEKAGFIPNIEFRDVDPSTIIGILPTSVTPPPLMMTKGRVYKVLSYKKYKNEMIWKKELREGDTSRMYTFTFKRDDDDLQELAVDLDDESFYFITLVDLLKLT